MHKEKLQEYVEYACARLNALIPCGSQADVDEMNAILAALFSLDTSPKSQMYWDRDVWIDSGFNDDTCVNALVYTDKLCFVPSDDMDEHPGVIVRYRWVVEAAGSAPSSETNNGTNDK